jgi:hypothetical protein
MGRGTTTQRGLGADHRKQVDHLKRMHRDGTPCWWCWEPMYLDPSRNPDKRPLSGDHSLARSHGGTATDRLLHEICNKRRRDGGRDDQRPALLKQRGGHADNALEWGT